MRYHYEPSKYVRRYYATVYICDHPVYSRCSLFKEGDKGLAIIQQRYDPETKNTWWTEVDEWIENDLYLQPGFPNYFQSKAKRCKDGLYPTVTVRQAMWALRMKPLPKERWETVFDHKDI